MFALFHRRCSMLPFSYRTRFRAVAATLAVIVTVSGVFAAKPDVTSKPKASDFKPPTSRPAELRQPEEVYADLDRAGQEMMASQPPMEALFEPAKRAEFAPKSLPAMRKVLPLL